MIWLLFILIKPFTTPSQSPEDEIQYVQDEIIVQFKGESTPRLIKVPIGQVEAEVERHKQMDEVDYVEPNYIVQGMFVPNDPLYPNQWNLGDPEQGGIEMEPAWNISTGKGVTVAVVDTGIAYEEYTSENDRKKYFQAPDLANTCFVPGYDFIHDDEHPNDDHGHGTHVAGTIAQNTNNGIGVAGIAYDACLMPIKVLDQDNKGDCYNFALSMRWAVDHGAQVINASLGSQSHSEFLQSAVAYAYNHGVVVLVSSGNDNRRKVSYPAAYNEYVIAVGATEHNKTRSPYSNYGPSLDLVAPGGTVADGIVQNTYKGSLEVFDYVSLEGTSMATPHVSGVAALLIANGNATTPDQVRTALEATAEDLGAGGLDNYYGWGLINAQRALNYNSIIDITVTPQKQDVYPEVEPPDNTAVYNVQLVARGKYVTMDIKLSVMPELSNNMFISSSTFSSPDFGTGMLLPIHLEDNDDTVYNMTLTIITGPQAPPSTNIVNFQVKAEGVVEKDSNQRSYPVDIEATSSLVALSMIPSSDKKFALVINDPKTVRIRGGEIATYQITVTSADDFEGLVDLSIPELTQYSVFSNYLDNIYISENPVDFAGLPGQSKVIGMTIHTNELPSNVEEIDLPFTVVGSNPNFPKETCEDKGLLHITNPLYVGEELREEWKSDAATWEFPAREIDNICQHWTTICGNPNVALKMAPTFASPTPGGWIDPIVRLSCAYNIPKALEDMTMGLTLAGLDFKGPQVMTEATKKAYEQGRRFEESINQGILNLRQQLLDAKDNN